jgi:hypothetical protein
MAGVSLAHRVGVTIQLDTRSLRRGSLQKLYGTRVKTDVHDETVGIPTSILKDANIDQWFMAVSLVHN